LPAKPFGSYNDAAVIQKLSRAYPPVLELLPLFLLFVVFYLAFTNYPSLPERIPVHFNFSGYPDGWGSKNQIFFIPGIATFLYLLVTGICLALSQVRDPKSMINMPESAKQKITPEKAEYLRIFLLRCLFILKTIILGMFTYLIYGSIEIALNRSESLGTFPAIFGLLIAVLVIFMVVISFKTAYSAR
jgi:uncharacterized membrane protein